MAIDQAEPVLVGIFTLSMLQNGRLSDIEVRRKQSTPTAAADVEIYRNTLAMPLASNQRSADASGPYNSAHQGELEHRSGRQLAYVAMHMALSAAISYVARIEDSHSPEINHNRFHEVSCH